MRDISRLLVAATCLCLGLSGPAATAMAADEVIRVMPLGDSITYGFGSSTGAGYRLTLADLIAEHGRPVDFVGSQRSGDLADPDNEGHSGWTVDDIAGQVDGWLAAYQPEIVLLHIGVNDLDHGADPARTADRLAALVDRIFTARPGVQVVLSGLIPNTGGLEDAIALYNERARALAATHQQAGRSLRFVAAPALYGAEMRDRLHPADPGYAKLGRMFFDALP